jgi:hypothetical protein
MSELNSPEKLCRDCSLPMSAGDPAYAHYTHVCRDLLKARCAELEQLQRRLQPETGGDSVCQEPDGCPTELAVLKRFWRERRGDLEFEPNKIFNVADMANVGHDLCKAIEQHRPDFTWNESPAEIVRALIDEVNGSRKSSPPPENPRGLHPNCDDPCPVCDYQDAARYRWLCEKADLSLGGLVGQPQISLDTWALMGSKKNELNAAIDDAIRLEGEPGDSNAK